MIAVGDSDKRHLHCFHCGTDKNVCEIDIDSNTKISYIGFGLCKECCARLLNKIANFWEEKEIYEEPKRGSFWDLNLVVDEEKDIGQRKETTNENII